MQSLSTLNPRAVLKRGYAIVTRVENGTVVKEASQVQTNDVIHVQVSQGGMVARITQTNPG